MQSVNEARYFVVSVISRHSNVVLRGERRLRLFYEASQILGPRIPSYRERARGVQNTSSDFTKDSISFWWSGNPMTGMS